VRRSAEVRAALQAGFDVDLSVDTERGNFGEGAASRQPEGGRSTHFFFEPRGEVHMQITGTQIPSKGDLVERRRSGVSRVGVVWYADRLQVLVKWQDGKSSSLRLGRDQFSIRMAAAEEARSLNGWKPGDSPSAEGQSDGETGVGNIRRNRVHRVPGAAV
jgi:hypothetical protein